MTQTPEAKAATFSDAENDLCISVNAITVALDYIGNLMDVGVTSGKLASRDRDAAMFLLHTANDAAEAARVTFYAAFENDPKTAFGRYPETAEAA
ncbi:MAG: hypothetical protein KKG78_02410 [Alphaproteobacteria bacterium]|nr:hypothetical protein [Alphaproteobacteria bacterium]